jgi:hypothetical protein
MLIARLNPYSNVFRRKDYIRVKLNFNKNDIIVDGDLLYPRLQKNNFETAGKDLKHFKEYFAGPR